MAEQTRGTRMAIVEESTEGTPVAPTASTDYLALQEGFTLTPNFEILENVEIRSTIAQAKSILGVENPVAEIAHYVKHSGTVATAPEDNLLLKNVFGETAIRATERDTVAGSTVSVINVDTGEGSEFQLGDALLIKHPSNDYEIRTVQSVSSDALTLGFAADNAPGTGVNLGRNVVYRPANTRGSLSVWDYRSNGAAVQLMAGGKVTELSMTAEAGQLLNGSYTINGLEFFFDPIEITATDTKLDFTDDDGTAAATITAKMYKDPHDLASALTTALNDVTTQTHSVTYSNTTGKYTISTSTSTLFSLLWNTGANTANTVGDAIGFDTSADDTGSTSYVADNTIHAPQGSATGGLASPQTPSLDTSNPLAVKDNEVFIGDTATTDNVCFSVRSLTATLTNTLASVLDFCATSGRAAQVTSERDLSIELVANLTQFDAEQFKDFRQGNSIRFQFNFGTKSGGNWEEGKSGCLYIPTATINEFSVTDTDGLVTLEMTLAGFTDGSGEVFLNFV